MRRARRGAAGRTGRIDAESRPIVICISTHTACGGSADPNKPHPHQGLLKKYEHLPPAQIGLKNLGVSDEQLRKGDPCAIGKIGIF